MIVSNHRFSELALGGRGCDIQGFFVDNWESCAAKLKLFSDGNTSDCEVTLQSEKMLGRRGLMFAFPVPERPQGQSCSSFTKILADSKAESQEESTHHWHHGAGLHEHSAPESKGQLAA